MVFVDLDFHTQIFMGVGSDFFLRHLIDGDAASNTLGWQWVAGLHTKGEMYLARRDNIRKFTEGRLILASFLLIMAIDEQSVHPKTPFGVRTDA